MYVDLPSEIPGVYDFDEVRPMRRTDFLLLVGSVIFGWAAVLGFGAVLWFGTKALIGSVA